MCVKARGLSKHNARDILTVTCGLGAAYPFATVDPACRASYRTLHLD